MHPTSYNHMREFAAKYLSDQQGVMADVGSLDVNGNYRDIFKAEKYIGIDISPGPCVDLILDDENKWPFSDNYFDCIISGSTFEHIFEPEKTMLEIERTLKPDGFCCIIAPSSGPHHGYPDDYHRFTVETLSKLAEDVGLIIVECYLDPTGTWKDVVLICQKSLSFNVSIIIPTINVDGCYRCIAAIKEMAGVDPSHYEIVTEIDDHGIGCPKMVAKLQKTTSHDWVMFLADDTEPEKDFLKNAIETAKNNPDSLMIGLNDSFHDGNNLATHWMCHKDLLLLTGGEFFHTGYNHLFCDNELIDIAKDNGVYTWAEDAKIKHNHPMVNGEGLTGHYESLYSGPNARVDHKLYLQRKIERGEIILGVGIPLTDEKVHMLFFKSFIMLEKPFKYVLLQPEFTYHTGDIAKCRNDLCRAAINSGCTHLVMMDTDQVYKSHDLFERLLNHNKPIVGGKVHRRYPPFEPILQRDGHHVPDEEINKGGLVQVDTTGTGCLMIQTPSLLDIDQPWFETTYDKNGNVKAGEDINFCRKAKANGFDIFVDCDVEIGHLSTLQVDSGIYELWKKLNKGVEL